MSSKTKWIFVPKARDIVDPNLAQDGERRVVFPRYSILKFLVNNILHDKRFAANWKTVKTAGEIEDAFAEEEIEGVWVPVHHSAHELMKAVCEEPSVPFTNPHLLTQVVDMFESIVDAKDEVPAGGRYWTKEGVKVMPPLDPPAEKVAEKKDPPAGEDAAA